MFIQNKRAFPGEPGLGKYDRSAVQTLFIAGSSRRKQYHSLYKGSFLVSGGIKKWLSFWQHKRKMLKQALKTRLLGEY
jgi:hypothetical protein